jgi:hypothetical protein
MSTPERAMLLGSCLVVAVIGAVAVGAVLLVVAVFP